MGSQFFRPGDCRSAVRRQFSARLSLEPLEARRVLSGDLSGAGTLIQVAPGTAFSGIVASFLDLHNPSDASQYSATIDWGDGVSSDGAVAMASGSRYTVSGSHTFAAGQFTVTVTFHDLIDDASVSADTQADIQAFDPSLHGVGKEIFSSPEVVVNNVVVAFFCDAQGLATASQFTTLIDWGDGVNSAGSLVAIGGGAFNVTGTHTYYETGVFSTATTIQFSRDQSTFLLKGDALITPLTPAEPPANLRDVASVVSHSAEYYANVIEGTYFHYLNRMPDDAGLHYWVSRMSQGTTDEQLEAQFMSSSEYIADHGDLSGWVQSMYRDLLGRAPDEAGLDYWVSQLGGGATPYSVAHGFAASAEREALRVAADYQTYLMRAPGQDEVDYWVEQFTQGRLNNEDVVAGFVGSPEYFNNPHMGHAKDDLWVTSAYEQLLQRPPSQFEVENWMLVLAIS